MKLWFLGDSPLSNFHKIFGQIYWRSFAEKGSTPGVETPAIPDVVDVVDAGDGVAGLGVDGLATSSSSTSDRARDAW